MSPSLTRAQREQAPPPPAKRNAWRCPTCGATGWGQNAHAAMTAGVRHFIETHDQPTRRT